MITIVNNVLMVIFKTMIYHAKNVISKLLIYVSGNVQRVQLLKKMGDV